MSVIATKDSARGKDFERWLAAKVGGRRRTNGERGGFDDIVAVEGGPFPVSLEAKACARLQMRTEWIVQAVRNSTGRPWAVVQRPLGSRTAYATVDLNFLIDLCITAGLIERQTEREETRDGGDPA